VVSLAVVGSDPDGDTLTWSAVGLPDGLSIDAATGVISGTVGYGGSLDSPFLVTVTVSDGGVPVLSDGVSFSWVVSDVNRVPVVVSPGDQSDAEGAVVGVSIFGSDPDGDSLGWSAAGLPDGLSIDPATGAISGTVGFEAAAGSPFSVTVTVTDGGVPSLDDSAVFSWTITDTNRAPSVVDPGDQSSVEGGSVSVAIAGSDPDGDTLVWGAVGLPLGMSIDAVSGVVSGSASYSAAGSYVVAVTASDDGVPSLGDSVSGSVRCCGGFGAVGIGGFGS
jgi:hypothetical protein